MSTKLQKYCLDANVLIQAWQKYYSPKFCPDYWTLLNEFGRNDRIFLPQNVFEEIIKTEDDLAEWIKQSKIPIYEVDGEVAECLRKVYAKNPIHQYLVDNTKQRSLADPWIIAHASKENACVVTKEEKVTTPNTTRIKIPNVCENMGIRWINDFQLVEELNIQFSCSLK
jgi:predicted nucleic acid-binding protein